MNAPPTIDDVIRRLGAVVDDASARGSRMGYFAALYRKVTLRVKRAIEEGDFEDGERMERLDVIFALRYLDAVEAQRAERPVSRSWKFTFDATDEWWPIVLQHLLLGMNAHINLDLGIAAAESVAPAQLPGLRADFGRINTILAEMVTGVQADLAEVWWPFRKLIGLLGDVDDAIVNFSMERARDHAWHLAEELAALDEAARADAIARRDYETVQLAHLVRRPGFAGGMVTKAIRLGERGSVPRIIGILG